MNSNKKPLEDSPEEIVDTWLLANLEKLSDEAVDIAIKALKMIDDVNPCTNYQEWDC